MIDNQNEFISKKPSDFKYAPQIKGQMEKYGVNQTVGRALVARDVLLGYKNEKNEQLKKRAERAENNSMTDVLTGLRNRRYFMGDPKIEDVGELQQEFAQAIRGDHDLTLLMIDIDSFKHINDTYGHKTGDEFLVQLAKALKLTFRQADILDRYGGEEFCVLLPETDTKNMKVLAERLHAYFNLTQRESGLLEKTGETSPRTISIGSTSLKDDQGNLRYGRDDTKMYEKFLEEADLAMYAAKGRGKNQTVIFNSPEYLEYYEAHKKRKS
jgi:diguanylate cyclase (GGDEF)-like protein